MQPKVPAWSGVIAAVAGLLATGRADAEVISSAQAGFSLRIEMPVGAPPAEVYSKLFEIGRWWSDEHTYTGKASNMSLRNEAGGCFCEVLDGGGFIRHAALEYSDKGRKIVRLSGALGPLQEMGASGMLTFSFLPAPPAAAQDTPRATQLVVTYVVSGYAEKGYAALAPLVDRVLREQLERLQRYVDTGKATP
jgi:hypothetical protein